MKECRQELAAALKTDLHKSATEAYITEIGLVEQEIEFILDHLDEWMKPECVSTNLLNLPGSSWIYSDPLGVVLIIGAWNYPVYLSLMPLVGAIAGGNCAVVKFPSDKYSRESSTTMARLLNQYLDPDCFQTVEGDRHATQAVLQQKFDKIFYTGGAFVGKIVAQAAAVHLTPTVLELGGKSPVIVDKTASLPVSAKRIAWGAFLNAGQTCIRPDHCFVHEDIADEFVRELQKAVTEMYGATAEEIRKSGFYGRLINRGAFERVAALVETDRDAIVFGGDLGDPESKFISPTLMDFGKDMKRFSESQAMQDEIFGPLLPMYRWNDLDEVVQFIKEREKPLAMYTFTEDSQVSERILKETSSGSSHVNDTMVFMSNPHLPFGGVGKSGMGNYHGKASFLAFTHRKSVQKRSIRLDVWARYPPYTDLKARVLDYAQFSLSRRQTKALSLLLFAIVLAAFRKTSAAGSLKEFLIWLITAILG